MLLISIGIAAGLSLQQKKKPQKIVVSITKATTIEHHDLILRYCCTWLGCWWRMIGGSPPLPWLFFLEDVPVVQGGTCQHYTTLHPSSPCLLCSASSTRNQNGFEEIFLLNKEASSEKAHLTPLEWKPGVTSSSECLPSPLWQTGKNG